MMDSVDWISNLFSGLVGVVITGAAVWWRWRYNLKREVIYALDELIARLNSAAHDRRFKGKDYLIPTWLNAYINELELVVDLANALPTSLVKHKLSSDYRDRFTVEMGDVAGVALRSIETLEESNNSLIRTRTSGEDEIKESKQKSRKYKEKHQEALMSRARAVKELRNEFIWRKCLGRRVIHHVTAWGNGK